MKITQTDLQTEYIQTDLVAEGKMTGIGLECFDLIWITRPAPDGVIRM